MTVSGAPVEIELTERLGPYGINNALRRNTNPLDGHKLFPEELPIDCLRLISAFNPTTAPETKFAMRAVSTAWSDASRDTLKLMWERLKAHPPGGSVPIERLMNKIEASTSPADYARRFKLLDKEFQKRGAPAPLPGSVIETTHEEFSAMQQAVADISLLKCWPYILIRIERANPRLLFVPRNLSVAEIRAYLQDPKNRTQLANVIDLTLEGLGLQSVPNELLYFPNLRYLYLSNNNLREFSPSLPMRRLIPLDSASAAEPLFRSWQQLQYLGLGSNNLTRIPDLSLLPPTAHVHLSANQIQFDHLPHRPGGMYFNYNPAYETLFGCLERMSYNYDYTVNPMNLLEFIRELKTYRARSPLGRLLHKAVFTAITDESLARKIARLPEADRQAIYYGVSKAALERYRETGNSAATDLPDGSPTYGEDHAFEDFDRLKVAIRHAILHKLYSLPEETQHRVFGAVYEAHGSPETEDLDWGRNHADKNIMLLADMIEAATES